MPSLAQSDRRGGGTQSGVQLRPCCLLFCPALVRGEGRGPRPLDPVRFLAGGSAAGSRVGTGKAPAVLTFLPKRGDSPGQNLRNGELHPQAPTRPSSCRNGATEETGGELPRLPSLPSSLTALLPSGGGGVSLSVHSCLRFFSGHSLVLPRWR